MVTLEIYYRVCILSDEPETCHRRTFQIVCSRNLSVKLPSSILLFSADVSQSKKLFNTPAILPLNRISLFLDKFHFLIWCVDPTSLINILWRKVGSIGNFKKSKWKFLSVWKIRPIVEFGYIFLRSNVASVQCWDGKQNLVEME